MTRDIAIEARTSASPSRSTAARSRPSRTSRSPCTRARPSPWWANPAVAIRPRARHHAALSKRATVSPKTEILYAAATWRPFPARDAGPAGQPPVDELPGTDVLAEPGLHHRQPDRRGPAHPQPDVEGRAIAKALALLKDVPDPRTRGAAEPVSAPAVGRPAQRVMIAMAWRTTPTS